MPPLGARAREIHVPSDGGSPERSSSCMWEPGEPLRIPKNGDCYLRVGPRMRVVTVAWLALGADLPAPRANTDAASAGWVEVDRATLSGARLRPRPDPARRGRAGAGQAGVHLAATVFCQREFTVAELRRVYEIVWGTELDPRKLHRKVTGTPGFVDEVESSTTRGGGRPATLYTAGRVSQLHPSLLPGGQ